jgi:hypothetical protein
LHSIITYLRVCYVSEALLPLLHLLFRDEVEHEKVLFLIPHASQLYSQCFHTKKISEIRGNLFEFAERIWLLGFRVDFIISAAESKNETVKN